MAESSKAIIRAERNFETTRAAYKSRPNEAEAAWQYARACFERAEFAKNDAERANMAREGILASRSVISHDSNMAAPHYYLALNLGQLARTKKMSALRIVREMEAEFDAARRLDEKFDHAGPDRGLGSLYLDAPGWPVSIGSQKKARQHFLRATQLCPNYPDNRLCLIEAYLRWNDHTAALKEVEELKKRWVDGRKRFTGEEWDSAWTDWQQRLDVIQARLTGPTSWIRSDS